MTREEYTNHIDKLSLHLTYPELDHLHAINESDADQREEIDRLRAALQEIADYDAGVAEYPGSCCSGCDSPGIAKAAIKEGA